MTRWHHIKYRFWFAETPRGQEAPEDLDRNHVFDLSFQTETHSDWHPYGATLAELSTIDVLDSTYDLRLDGEPITPVEAQTRFGTKYVVELMVWMEIHAEASEPERNHI